MNERRWRFLGDTGRGPVLAPVHVGGAEGLEDLDRRCRAVSSGFSGGTIVLDADPDEELLRNLGRALEIDGRFFAAHGPGAGTEELTVLREETSRVLGLDSGFPSPFTALGAFAAIRACVSDLASARVAVLGAGHVGTNLVAMLLEAGSEVLVADLDPGKAAATGAIALDVSELLVAGCDVYSPNARGPALTPDTVGRIRTRFVAGAANGQLASPGMAGILEDRGIGFVPEEIAGSGWILNLAAELHSDGYDESRARRLVRSIEDAAREHLGAGRC